MIATLLLVVTAALAYPVPRLMARRHRYRRAPRAALVAWQAVSLAAVVAALAAPVALIPELTDGEITLPRNAPLLALVAGVSGLILGRLIVNGHLVGTRLRAVRRQHRELVDIIATHQGSRTRVLAHPMPTAYCLPGRRSRVILSEGTLATLPPDQLQAVIEHELAHLHGRHDLLLEYFTVIHEAVPPVIRCEEAMSEVRLLIEALADRRAVRSVGEHTTARALVNLARAQAPEGALAAGGSEAPTRLRLLAAGYAPAPMRAVMYLYAGSLLALPLGLLAVAWLR